MTMPTFTSGGRGSLEVPGLTGPGNVEPRGGGRSSASSRRNVADNEAAGSTCPLESVDAGLHRKLKDALARVERETAARKRAEANTKATNELLATIAHEIRTPLSSIIGFAEMLMKSDQGDFRLPYCRWITKSASHALDITNDLLDITKAESGKMVIKESPFDLRVLCEEVADLLAPQAAAKGIGLSFRCSSQLPDRLLGDPGRIRQILLNLTTNAIKFTDDGLVLIDAACVSHSDNTATLTMKVMDTGIGIPADKLPLLFRKFSQVGSPSGRTTAGTGLGLWISKRLVEMMNGHIGAESSEGNGCVVWFSLRLPVPDRLFRETQAAERATTVSHEGLDVLVVEDDPASQIVAAAMLQSMGCRITMASNGIEAVEMAQQSSYDLIFMDCCLPSLDGFEAVARIRQWKQGRKQPVIIALTANAAAASRRECFNAGMDDFLSKPIRFHELQRILAQWAPSDCQSRRGSIVHPEEPACPTAADCDLDAKRMAAVSSMFKKTGKDFFPSAIEPFLKAAEDAMPTLHTAIRQKQVPVVRQTLHRLQGGSSSVGIERISGICLNMLENIRDNGLRDADRYMNALECALPQVREQVYALKESGLI